MLTEDQEAYLEHLLTGLLDVRGKLNEKSRAFVDQIQEAFTQYGAHTRLSPKQLTWLEKLYMEHIGEID